MREKGGNLHQESMVDQRLNLPAQWLLCDGRQILFRSAKRKGRNDRRVTESIVQRTDVASRCGNG